MRGVLTAGRRVVAIAGAADATPQDVDQARRLLLLRPLVLRHSWAKRDATHPNVVVADGVDTILEVVAATARQQLRLSPAR